MGRYPLGCWKRSQPYAYNRYYAVGDDFPYGDRSYAETLFPAGVLKGLTVKVAPLNTTDADCTIAVLRNGVAIYKVTVPAGTTGTFKDIHDETIAEGDLICLNVNTLNATTGYLHFNWRLDWLYPIPVVVAKIAYTDGLVCIA
ncbi:MAG: hypothetical protein QXH20_04780 [Candidatus Bathyarchaeia archaeon]